MSLKCFKEPTERQVMGGAWAGGNTVGEKVKEEDRLEEIHISGQLLENVGQATAMISHSRCPHVAEIN